MSTGNSGLMIDSSKHQRHFLDQQERLLASTTYPGGWQRAKTYYLRHADCHINQRYTGFPQIDTFGARGLAESATATMWFLFLP